MSFDVRTLEVFERKAKRLVKKYPSLKFEIRDLVAQLKLNPEQGIALGNGCYKIRLSVASKGKGKAGGARVITCIRIAQNCVFLLTIFDKSEQESISNLELKELLGSIPA
jgi:hypothetical protein